MIYLPYEDLMDSALVFHEKHLVHIKGSIKTALTGIKNGNMKNFRWVNMWIGNEDYIKKYYGIILEILNSAGDRYTLDIEIPMKKVRKPWFIGMERVHRGQKALVLKKQMEIMEEAIRAKNQNFVTRAKELFMIAHDYHEVTKNWEVSVRDKVWWPKPKKI